MPHYGRLRTSTGHLSSGLRINSSADDAAGLAIRELMRSDIAALNQGVRNANDAISLIQVADGALGIIDEKLIRMIDAAGQTVTAGGATIEIKTNMNEIPGWDEVIKISEITDDLVFMIGGHETGACNNYRLRIEADFDENFISMLTEHRATGAIGIETQEKAQQALTRIDDAIVRKDKIRAHLGALQNRLENTVSNLTIQADNLQSAESRISDADIATEMTNFIRNQILTQSAVAMLSQANSLPQMAMQLIS